MIEAVFLDAYGTLLDTGDGSVSATQAILAKHGCPLAPTEVYALWKRYHKEHILSLTSFIREEDVFVMDLKRLYAELGIPGYAQEDVQIMLATLGTRRAFPEAMEVVRTLRRRHRVYIASTSDSAPLHRDLARNGLAVDEVFTSESLQAYKPKREFYDRLLDAAAIQAENALFVGDSIEDDVSGPAAVGFRTVWVNRRKRSRPGCGCRPDHEIATLAELPLILQSAA